MIDRTPRELDPAQMEALRVLGRQVITQLELRRAGQALGASLAEQCEITDRLRESEQRFAILSEEAPVGIFETDTIGRCTYANRQWLRFAGMPLERALGCGWIQYQADGSFIRFTRGADGRINGFDVSASRMLKIRFNR